MVGSPHPRYLQGMKIQGGQCPPKLFPWWAHAHPAHSVPATMLSPTLISQKYLQVGYFLCPANPFFRLYKYSIRTFQMLPNSNVLILSSFSGHNSVRGQGSSPSPPAPPDATPLEMIFIFVEKVH